ncbi:MAG: hypothetical protein M1165_01905 [Candidatus Pacearchaeota archaeon]|nr:hypothetical protein [Candidatus Pacearchaeota archaeon]
MIDAIGKKRTPKKTINDLTISFSSHLKLFFNEELEKTKIKDLLFPLSESGKREPKRIKKNPTAQMLIEK